MTLTQAKSIVNALPRAVLSTQPGPIRQAFSALVVLDAHHITQSAAQMLNDLLPATLIALCPDRDYQAHWLTMEVFNTSLLTFLQDKPANVESSVVDDIPSWIEANAAAVASANLHCLEAALPDEDAAQAHRSLIELHHHIDFVACEQEQNATLQSTWSAIAQKIDAYLEKIQEA